MHRIVRQIKRGLICRIKTDLFNRLENIAATGETGPVYSHMGHRSKEAGK